MAAIASSPDGVQPDGAIHFPYNASPGGDAVAADRVR